MKYLFVFVLGVVVLTTNAAALIISNGEVCEKASKPASAPKMIETKLAPRVANLRGTVVSVATVWTKNGRGSLKINTESLGTWTIIVRGGCETRSATFYDLAVKSVRDLVGKEVVVKCDMIDMDTRVAEADQLREVKRVRAIPQKDKE